MRVSILAITVLVAGQAIGAEAPPARLEVRFAPAGYVYLAQENRFFFLADVEIQNVAIVNPGPTPVTLDEVLVEILLQGEVFRTERITGAWLVQRWARLKGWLDTPGTLTSEDPRFRFRELLGDQPKLSFSATLAPGAAIYVTRRFYFVDALIDVVDGEPRPAFPDRLRVTATGATADGERVRATNEIRIVRYQPRNEYHFPVEGRWYVGSSSSVRSHHRSQPAHEFALDLIQVGENGSSYRGDGSRHSDYYAYGKDVLAIGDGVVAAVYGDVPETRLRRAKESLEEYRQSVMEPLSARGPMATGGDQVVIEHPGQEFSTYAHLKSGSIKVKKGDRVRIGQPIGQLGLSGDGYQPHLHVQLTDGADPSYSRGIPLIFTNVKPVPFSSTLDTDGRRQLQTGEFVETVRTPAQQAAADR
jgi:murein DD-endopeptidase MepM/ murein hydrolase activator NlpD